MDNDNIKRWNLRVLAKALKTRRAVIISGSRQCGKSTLLEMFFSVGVVLYTGKETLSFGNGMLAVPMSVLWS